MTILQMGAWAQEEARAILDWWLEHDVDASTGGFYGRVARDGTPAPDAPRLLVLGARLVWTYAAAYRVLGDEKYREAAQYFYRYFMQNFWDQEHGGAFWEISAQGAPLDTTKRTYGEAFALYALSEYARATGDDGAKARALELFALLEKHVLDAEHGGYRESLSCDWTQDKTASGVINPEGDAFTMNTSLHLVEAYTNLLRIEDSAAVRQGVQRLFGIMTQKVLKGDRFAVFFDKSWQRTDTLYSFGHDIEGSWLLYETAEVLKEGLEPMREASIAMARAALKDGVDPQDGALYNELNYATGHLDALKGWWQQAEAVVGFVGAYQLSGDEALLQAAVRTVSFIQEHIKDPVHGEWFPSADGGGWAEHIGEKVSGWKCPYHNARMCFELIERCAHMQGA